MSRISESFLAIRASGQKGFIPFITAGDPDPDTTVSLIKTLAEFEPVAIELGVPFSDPIADGPTIQRSSQRALERHSTSVVGVIDIVREARKSIDTPIVLFGYLNPFLQFGIDRLATELSDTAIDGILFTDITGAELHEISKPFRKREIDVISLVAPTTTDERIATIANFASGFIYAIARNGVTGDGNLGSDQAKELVARIRLHSDLPIAVGFGISTGNHISEVLEFADAAVVGSAIVSVIENSDSGKITENVYAFIEELL